MAGTALRAELAVVHIPRGMAGETILWCAFEYVIHVAGFACHRGVGAGQGKGSFAVIEGNVFPAAGGMTPGTFGPELTFMYIFGGMTGDAIFRRALEDAIHVTCPAGDIGMQATQWEGCFAVIETYILPAAGMVAGRAILAKLALVDIRGNMAGETVLRCTLVDSVFMAARAAHNHMLPHECKRSRGMIEAHCFPVRGGMAFRTVVS
jgi:hypothetical protein